MLLTPLSLLGVSDFWEISTGKVGLVKKEIWY